LRSWRSWFGRFASCASDSDADVSITGRGSTPGGGVLRVLTLKGRQTTFAIAVYLQPGCSLTRGVYSAKRPVFVFATRRSWSQARRAVDTRSWSCLDRTAFARSRAAQTDVPRMLVLRRTAPRHTEGENSPAPGEIGVRSCRSPPPAVHLYAVLCSCGSCRRGIARRPGRRARAPDGMPRSLDHSPTHEHNDLSR
jgi:hypothetical protein